MFRVVGIDPGVSGGAAEIVVGPGGFTAGRVADLPKAGPDVDVRRLVDWALDGDVPLTGVAIEEVGFIPGDQFRTYAVVRVTRVFGEILGAFRGRGVKVALVRPQAWQKATGGAPPAAKRGTGVKAAPGEESRKAAEARRKDRRQKIKDGVVAWVRSTYPDVNLTPGKKVKPVDGWADAVGIAHWAAAVCRDLVPFRPGDMAALPGTWVDLVRVGGYELESTQYDSTGTIKLPPKALTPDPR